MCFRPVRDLLGQSVIDPANVGDTRMSELEFVPLLFDVLLELLSLGGQDHAGRTLPDVDSLERGTVIDTVGRFFEIA